MAKRAAIYRRVSTDEQVDNYSLGSQAKECRALCERMGYAVVVEQEDVSSGYKLEKRAGLDAIRAMIRAGEIDVLVIWKLDRLSRRMWHVPALLQEAEDNGVIVASVLENLDTSTVLGKTMIMLLASHAEQERDDFRKRSEAERRSRAEAGRPLVGPRAPYGYQWRLGEQLPNGARRKTGLDHNPATAPTMRRIWELLYDGTSQHGVCAVLNGEGVPTPNGAPFWDKGTIQRLIRNPLYWGEGAAFRHTKTEVKRTDPLTGERHTVTSWKLTDESAHVPIPVESAPPIISAEIAHAVRARLAENTHRTARGNLNPEAYLMRGGFVKCFYCGRGMTCRLQRDKKTGKERFSYRCATQEATPGRCTKSQIEAGVLDRAAWGLLLKVLSEPAIIEREVWRITQTSDPTADRRADVRKRIAGYEDERGKVARSIARLADEDMAAPLEAELIRLGKLIREGKAELEELGEEFAGWQAAQASIAHLAELCASTAPRVDELTHKEKQQLLWLFGIQATVRMANDKPAGQAERYVLDVLPFARQAAQAANSSDVNGTSGATEGRTIEHSRNWS